MKQTKAKDTLKLNYRVFEDGTLEIIPFSERQQTLNELVIPAEIDGKKVSRIAPKT